MAGLLGMGAAIDYAMNLGLDRIWATIHQAATTLRGRLAAIPGVTVRDIGPTQGGIVSFDMDGIHSDEIVEALSKHSINTVTSSVSSTRFDMENRGLEKVVRASVHYLTTEDEIDALIAVVDRCATRNTSLPA